MKVVSYILLTCFVLTSLNVIIAQTSCSTALELHCGTSNWYPASTHNNFTKDNYNFSACANHNWSYNGNDRLFFVNMGATPRRLTIRLSGLSSDLDLLVFRSCNGSKALTDCVALSVNPSTAKEEVVIENATGIYYIAVDGYAAGAGSGYDLDILCADAPTHASCTEDRKLTCGSSIWVNASTVNRFDAHSYNLSACHASGVPNYGGNDHVYLIDVGVGKKDIEIRLTDLAANLDLLIFKSCGGSKFSNCVATSRNTGKASETIKLTDAVGFYYLVVDGATPSDRSGYELTVRCNTNTHAGYSCRDAQPLHCGDRKWVNASHSNRLNASNYDFANCVHHAFSYEGNDHLYRVSTGPGTKNVTITMSGLTADLDLLLFRNCSESWGKLTLTPCVNYSIKSGNTTEVLTIHNATGDYYLAVDGFTTGVKSGYELRMDCHTAPDIDCFKATPLKCGDTKWVHAPTTNQLDDSVYDLSGCTGWAKNYKGADHLYKIDLGSDKRDIKIMLSDLRADMDLLLFQSCETSWNKTKLTRCMAMSNRSGTSNEVIELFDVSGTYYLAVDSNDPWAKTGYEIKLICTTPRQQADCHHALPLKCGDRKWVHAPTSNSFDLHNIDISGCGTSSHGYKGNDHLYKLDVGNHPTTLRIKLSDLSANLDMFLFSSCGWHSSHSKLLKSCVASSRKSGRSAEFIELHNAKGVYYLLIDADDPWDKSGYELSVDCHHVPAYDCNHAVTLRCGDNKWFAAPTASNLDKANYDLSKCTHNPKNYAGMEHFYKIDVGNTKKKLQIKMSGLSADMDLLLFKTCSTSGSKVRLQDCVGLSARSGNSEEVIELDDASGWYYLVVESGHDWHKSGYDLTIKCVDEPAFSCAQALPLHCGARKWVQAPTRNNLTGDNYNFSACLNNKPTYSGNDHLYRIDVGNHKRTLKIRLTDLQANLDLLVFKSCTQNAHKVQLGSCAAVSNKSGKNSEEVIIKDATGTYYIVVDSPDPWVNSGYEIAVDCIEEKPVVDCNSAIALSCGTDKWFESPKHNSLSISNYDLSGCFNSSYSYNGFDHLYLIKAPAGKKTLKIVMTGLSADFDILLFKKCTNSGGKAFFGQCSGYSKNLNRADETIEVKDAEGEYYLVIDSADPWAVSSYRLKISCEEPSTSDPDPIDPDEPVDSDPTNPTDFVLTCGNSVSGTTRGATSEFSRADILGCFDTELNFNGPDKLIAFEKTSADDIIMLTMTQDGGNLSLFILNEDFSPAHIRCKGWNYNTSKQVNNAVAVGEVFTDADDPLPIGRYYALIEGFAENVAADFVLSLACGIDCSEAQSLSCVSLLSGESSAHQPDNHSMYFNEDEKLLVGYSGGEKIYTFTINQESEVLITMTNLTEDLDMFLVQGDCIDGEIIKSSINIAINDERISTTVSPGDYILIIDGWHDSESSYDLYIEFCDPSGAAREEVATARSFERAHSEDHAIVESVMMIPNPFSDNLRIELSSSKDQQISLVFYGADGREISRRQRMVNAGLNNILMDSGEFSDYKGLLIYDVIMSDSRFHGKIIKY